MSRNRTQSGQAHSNPRVSPCPAALVSRLFICSSPGKKRERDRVKGDVVATSTVERNRALTMTTAVRSPDTASAHYFVFQLQSAAEELKRQGSDKVDSSSSMCLPFFPMSFQTPQNGHACTELCISDKKLKFFWTYNLCCNSLFFFSGC